MTPDLNRTTSASEPLRTYEHGQPWVVYTYPYDDAECDKRGLLAHVVMECSVCGVTEDWTLRRGETPPELVIGRTPARNSFLLKHLHFDRGAPMSWAKPLLNPAAHEGGIDPEALAMRLEADLNDFDGGA